MRFDTVYDVNKPHVSLCTHVSLCICAHSQTNYKPHPAYVSILCAARDASHGAKGAARDVKAAASDAKDSVQDAARYIMIHTSPLP